MDRHAINQALAKCVAYQAVGKTAEARQWFERLTQLLGYEGYRDTSPASTNKWSQDQLGVALKAAYDAPTRI